VQLLPLAHLLVLGHISWAAAHLLPRGCRVLLLVLAAAGDHRRLRCLQLDGRARNERHARALRHQLLGQRQAQTL
jgi:uncharacterized membrane protein